MAARALIVHRSRRRLRLRIPDRRHDPAFLSTLARTIAGIPGVLRATPSPATAGVLVELEAVDGDRVAEALQSLDSISCDTDTGMPADKPAGTTVLGPSHRSRLIRADDWLRWVRLERRTVALLLFTALAVRRLAKSGYLAPALALLWLLYEIYRHRVAPPPAR